MPVAKKLEKFIKENKIKAEPIEHRIVYTAFDKAITLRVPQKIVGKTLALRLDKSYVLALIPANKKLDKGKFKKVASFKKIDFVTEAWIKKNIKGVKIGAVPPFGSLWKLPTFIDRSLMHQSKIIVNGGDWKWSVKISPAVFKKSIPNLIIGNFSKSR